MPTYDYLCQSCGARFSVTTTISEHGRQKVHCSECQSEQVTRVFSAFYAKTIKKS